MSHSRELLQHIGQLQDISSILNSMKNLAFIETRKLERFLPAQRQVVASIETAAADLLAFYPDLRTAPGQAAQLLILLGSERGFCGDFNEQLIAAFRAANATISSKHAGDAIKPIGIGRKLCGRLEELAPTCVTLPGADVAEEIPTAIHRLLAEITELQTRHAGLNITVLYQDAYQHQVNTRLLLPPFHNGITSLPGHGLPPLLNLQPDALFGELLEHYLFAVLHEIFYNSLLAENQRRLQHMQGAVQHLEQRAGTLTRKYNTVRQEEITEEIEVILITADSLSSSIFKA